MLDLTAPSFMRAPHEQLVRALDRSCFAETRIILFGKVKLVLGHPEIQDMLKDGGRFAVDARNAGHASPFGMKFLPASLRVLSENLLALDDPRHRELRHMVDGPFRRVQIEQLAPSIRETADQLVDDMSRDGENDIVAGLCRELPLQVIFDLLGFSGETRGKLHDVMKGLAGGGSAFDVVRAIFRLKPAQAALRREFENVRSHPRPGLVSELANAGGDGGQMSDDELLAMVFVLFVAGHETTSHLLSTATYTLLTQPGAAYQFRSLGREARLVAIDELQRYCSPVQMTKPRHARRDMEFHGQSLKEGERVMGLLAAGNLDSRVFEIPTQLDLARRPNRHLGWGGGPHMCLGLHLARTEVLQALSVLFDRFQELALDTAPDNLRWTKRTGLRGLKALPLSLQ